MESLKDQAAIVGIGETVYNRDSGRSLLKRPKQRLPMPAWSLRTLMASSNLLRIPLPRESWPPAWVFRIYVITANWDPWAERPAVW